jgi:diaminopimelate decarboxylase
MMGGRRGLGPLGGVLPESSTVTPEGHLAIGGCDTVDLAARFGTPLYVYDAASIQAACRAYRAALVAPWPANSVHYAAKAYFPPVMGQLLLAEGLSVDVFSTAELHLALAAGLPTARIRFHGLHRSAGDLEEACRAGVGAVVLDSLAQIDVLAEACRRAGRRQPVLLRLATGIAAHPPSAAGQPGTTVSALGLGVAGGVAEEALGRCLRARAVLEVRGYHTHLGTQIRAVEPFRLAVSVLVRFAVEMDERHGYWPAEVSPGGGLAVPYTPEEVTPTPADLAAAVMAPLVQAASARGRVPPAVSLEPGRSLVGRAAVALYRVHDVTIEESGARRRVHVDGSTAQSMRPALCTGPYSVLAANLIGVAGDGPPVALAGRDDAPDDVPATDTVLPPLRAGDLLAVACVGAYGLRATVGSAPVARPAVVLVKDGEPQLIAGAEEGAA